MLHYVLKVATISEMPIASNIMSMMVAMMVASTSETHVSFCKTTCCNIPEDRHLQITYCLKGRFHGSFNISYTALYSEEKLARSLHKNSPLINYFSCP
jgi:hypothetical protein